MPPLWHRATVLRACHDLSPPSVVRRFWVRSMRSVTRLHRLLPTLPTFTSPYHVVRYCVADAGYGGWVRVSITRWITDRRAVDFLLFATAVLCRYQLCHLYALPMGLTTARSAPFACHLPQFAVLSCIRAAVH